MADLSDANCFCAELRYSDLTGAALCRARLQESNLASCNFRRANLSNADLQGANLFGADLSGAFLYRVNFSDTSMDGVTVTGSRFSNNRGISRDLRRKLIQRGATFED
jgi:uncharacterized protein YjbI with pentapeptide repeats